MRSKSKLGSRQGRAKSRAYSLATLASWPLALGFSEAAKRYRRLSEFKPNQFDKNYYQREVHDLDGLHPVVHYLDRGEALGFRPVPPTPRAQFVGTQPISDPGSRLLAALTFRPPVTSRIDHPIGRSVDIIMPCFNRRDSVGEAIRSVLDQTFGDQRLIVVDDGSTDGSVAHIASEYTAEIASGAICLIEAGHGGVSAARNVGLSNVTADWVAYLDSDNRWTPDHLEHHLKALNDQSRGWSYGAMISEGEPQFSPTEPYNRYDLLQHNAIDLNTMVHRADWLQHVGGFDTRLRRLVDYDLALRLGRLGAPARVDTKTVHYSLSVNSISAKENFLTARTRVRLSHVCERTSWGLVRPRLYLEPGPLAEVAQLLQSEKLAEIVKSPDDANLCAGVGGTDAKGQPSILIYESSMTLLRAPESKLAVILGDFTSNEWMRPDMLAKSTQYFHTSADGLGDRSIYVPAAT